LLSRHFWREHRPVTKHGKISSSEQNRYCNIQPSELESRNEANKTLFHAWNKRPKEGTEQGKLISRCQFKIAPKTLQGQLHDPINEKKIYNMVEVIGIDPFKVLVDTLH